MRYSGIVREQERETEITLRGGLRIWTGRQSAMVFLRYGRWGYISFSLVGLSGGRLPLFIKDWVKFVQKSLDGNFQYRYTPTQNYVRTLSLYNLYLQNFCIFIFPKSISVGMTQVRQHIKS